MGYDGLVLAHCVYDAWGELKWDSNPTTYGYKGQWGYYRDMETGLLLLTHRYLDPASGRFLTRDPIGVEGGVNLYTYVHNRVVNRVDPEGLCIKIGNDCYGFDCHGDPDCPPAKKPKPNRDRLRKCKEGCVTRGVEGEIPPFTLTPPVPLPW